MTDYKQHDEDVMDWTLSRIVDRFENDEEPDAETKAILLHVDLHQLAFIDALKERMGLASRRHTCAVMFQLAFDKISAALPDQVAEELMLEVDEHFAELESQTIRGKE